MLAPASRDCLIVPSRVSLVMIRIGIMRFSLSTLRRIARVSERPPCGGRRASQSRMSIFCALKVWRTSIEFLTSRTLLVPKPRSMPCAIIDRYELGSAIRTTKSRRFMVGLAAIPYSSSPTMQTETTLSRRVRGRQSRNQRSPAAPDGRNIVYAVRKGHKRDAGADPRVRAKSFESWNGHRVLTMPSHKSIHPIRDSVPRYFAIKDRLDAVQRLTGGIRRRQITWHLMGIWTGSALRKRNRK